MVALVRARFEGAGRAPLIVLALEALYFETLLQNLRAATHRRLLVRKEQAFGSDLPGGRNTRGYCIVAKARRPRLLRRVVVLRRGQAQHVFGATHTT